MTQSEDWPAAALIWCFSRHLLATVQEFKPDAQAIKAAEAIARASGLDIGGIEFMIDERDGARRFYDINGLSNFVADPLNVLGWDPHEKLVDYLINVIASKREKAA